MIRFIRRAGRIIPIRAKKELGYAAMEITGLSVLAAPSAYKIATDKSMSHRKEAAMELGGLAILGAATFKNSYPAIAKLARALKGFK